MGFDLGDGDAEIVGDPGDQRDGVAVPRPAVKRSEQNEALNLMTIARRRSQPRAAQHGAVERDGIGERRVAPRRRFACLGRHGVGTAGIGAQNDATLSAEGAQDGGSRHGKRFARIDAIAHRAENVAQQALAQIGARQGGVAFARCRDVAANAARAAPIAVAIEHRRGRQTQACARAIGPPQPELKILDRLARAEGVGVVLRIDEKIARPPADQFGGGIAERAARRDEQEGSAAVGLPGEVAGDIDKVLVALARFDQRSLQVAVERRGGVARLAKRAYHAGSPVRRAGAT